MARPIPPPRGVHVVRKRLRDGTVATYHYAWRGGPRLPDPSDQRAYLIAYAEALKARVEPVRRTPATLVHLIAAYRQGDRYGRLAYHSRRTYEKAFTAIEEHFGSLPVEALAARGMRAEIRRWHADYPHTRAADTRLQVLVSLLSWAVEHDLAPANPAKGIARRHEKTDHSDTIWTPDELEKLFEAADPPTRRACVLAAYTGLRFGDCIGLRWSEVDTDAWLIERPTNKSRGKVRAYIPILAPLRAVLAECDPSTPTVLVSAWGRPWSEGGLQTAFFRAKAACGIDKRFHDLRGTAATMFARAGLTAPEVARIMGWGEARVEEIIRRYVSRRETAAAIARKLDDRFTDS